MAHPSIEISDNLIRARIQGVMQVADQDALQAVARDLIVRGKKLRLLATLKNFRGWEK